LLIRRRVVVESVVVEVVVSDCTEDVIGAVFVSTVVVRSVWTVTVLGVVLFVLWLDHVSFVVAGVVVAIVVSVVTVVLAVVSVYATLDVPRVFSGTMFTFVFVPTDDGLPWPGAELLE
jgi:hypothetical protein